ncbi:MAG: response regulator [Betaproteobacteria bacterium]|nr:MAG: response regulator [Betaproteobacteria bacterium]
MCSATLASAFKVFIVEDSPIIRERLLELLGSIEGAAAIGQASRAAEAIDGILATQPDAVVLDLRLADGSGFDVLRAVHERAPGIELYMLSNFAAEPYRRMAARLGARDFFDKSNEFQRVREVLAARAAQHVH